MTPWGFCSGKIKYGIMFGKKIGSTWIISKMISGAAAGSSIIGVPLSADIMVYLLKPTGLRAPGFAYKTISQMKMKKLRFYLSGR